MQPQRSGGYTASATIFILSTLVMSGCNSTTPEGETSDRPHGHEHGHDHGHRPESLHIAVDQLAEIEQAVAAAIMSGDADAADGPLHEVVELLEALPDIAAETDLPKAEWEAVKAASDRLFKAYGVIHDEFHGKAGKESDKQTAYTKVASELNEALEEIRSRLPLTGEEAPMGDLEVDQGHDEHEEHEHDTETQPAPQVDGTDS